MKLVLTRSQRSAGLMGGKNVFVLEARAELDQTQAALLQKYKLMDQVLYSSEAARKNAAAAEASVSSGSMWGLAKGLGRAALHKLTLNVTIQSLLNGVKIETQSLDESLSAEEAIKEGAQNLSAYVNIAQTYDGRPRIYALSEEGEFELQTA